MAITNFNPGPWHADEPLRGSVLVRSRGCVIAEVIPQATAVANARLIALAPEFYTVLDAFLSDLDEYGEVGFTLRQRARALLNKVEGLTP